MTHPLAIAATILKDCRTDAALAVLEMQEGDLDEAERILRALFNRLGALLVMVETEVERVGRVSS